MLQISADFQIPDPPRNARLFKRIPRALAPDPISHAFWRFRILAFSIGKFGDEGKESQLPLRHVRNQR